jgi:hypothetical protein
MIARGAEIDWDKPGHFPTIRRMPSLAWLERPFAEALRALDERGRR